jgi:hypothetical protein
MAYIGVPAGQSCAGPGLPVSTASALTVFESTRMVLDAVAAGSPSLATAAMASTAEMARRGM